MATKPTAAIARLLDANNNAYDEVSNPGGLAEGGHRQNFVPNLQATVDVGEWVGVMAGEVEAQALAVAEASEQTALDVEASANSAASAIAAAEVATAAAGTVDGAAIGARFDDVEADATALTNRVAVLEDIGYRLALSEHFGA